MSARGRIPALLALAVPTLSGIAWMAANGAPSHYPLVNLGALLLACGWIALGKGPNSPKVGYALTALLIALMLAPLLTGPDLTSVTGNRVSRWIPLLPLTLNTGMLAVPGLAVLAARHSQLAAPILLAGIFAALLQPDCATGIALTFAAVGLHHVNRDWKVGAAAIAGFLASIAMALRGELTPQPFVERVLVDATQANALTALGLVAALVFAFVLIARAIPAGNGERLALAGTLFGFSVVGVMSNYPSALIGYGAAPILGFGFALGLYRKSA